MADHPPTSFPDSHGGAARAEARGSAPDWDKIAFDVRCARCGNDLRGQTEPICSACSLVFDWNDAVPIDELTCSTCGYCLYGLETTRCPECGDSFTWESILEDLYRRRKAIFEYCWRHHPVRSFARSFRLALQPTLMWNTIQLHDPPRWIPLGLMVVIAVTSFVVMSPVSDASSSWNSMRRLPTYGSYSATEFIKLLMDHVANPASYLFPFIVLSWMTASLLALLVFKQSMRACKVRTVHVVRVWSYAIAMMLPLVPLFRYLCRYGQGSIRPYWFPDPQPYAAAIFILFVMWSIRQGYCHYLKMPHAVAVAVASQTIAILLTATAFFAIPYFFLGAYR